MIVYLDTSALVKLYAYEEGLSEARAAVEAADAVATSRVAFAEAHAAFAAAARLGRISAAELHHPGRNPAATGKSSCKADTPGHTSGRRSRSACGWG